MAKGNDMFDRAVRHHREGDLVAAEALYLKALRRNARDLRALVNLGNLLLGLGRTDEAVIRFEQALSVDDKIAGVHTNLGVSLSTLERHEDAVRHHATALALEPDNPTIRLNYGNALKALGDYEGAADSYRHALEANPNHPIALSNYGDTLRRLGQVTEALACLERAVAARPDDADTLVKLAFAWRADGADDEAITRFEQALSQAPEHTAALNGLGLTLQDRGRFDEAEPYFRRALASAPDQVEPHYNLGNNLKAQHRFGEALEAFDAALAIAPKRSEARLNRALLRLQLGDFARGWVDYEARWQVADCPSPPRDFTVPEWAGASLEGRGVLVYGEQGPGDVVMFASCLDEIIAGAERVVVQCEPRLVALLGRSFPGAQVISDRLSDGTSRPAPAEVDCTVAFGSLPRVYRADEARFSGHERYLATDPNAVQRWRERLAALGPNLKVGIAWRGGANNLERHLRTMRLDDWLPVFGVEGVSFVNLQYGARAEELAAFEERHGIVIADWPDAVEDLDDFAAQIDALDLVISIAGTAVHFAGALGSPTWALVPRVPSWRWMDGRTDCPWYPSVTLIRQSVSGDWADVLARAGSDLEAFARRARPTAGHAAAQV